MPLETGTYISDLVVTNPPGSDGLSQGDDHLRLIKSTIKTTFPNITGALTPSQGDLNERATGTRKLGLADGSSGTPSAYFDAETGNGFYRPSAGKLQATKRLLGNGTLPVGTIHAYPIDPGTTLCARGGTATGGEQFIEPDGSVYNASTFPDLFALFGSIFGGNGTTTFGVPDWKTTGKFLRHRSGSAAPTIAQSSQNKSHTHTYSASSSGTTAIESVTHTHTYSGSGTTGVDNEDHTHTTSVTLSGTTSTDPGHVHGGGIGFSNSNGVSSDSHTVRGDTFSYFVGRHDTDTAGSHSHTWSSSGSFGSGGASNRHDHGFSWSGTTATESANHTHTFSYSLSGTTSTGSADGTEARPEAIVVFYCIKT